MSSSPSLIPSNVARHKFLSERQLGIGGSDAAAILGVDKYRGPLAVYEQKVNPEYAEQLDTNRETNEPAYWGTRLEDLVADEFRFRSGLTVAETDEHYVHPLHPCMVGHIDRLVMFPWEHVNYGKLAFLECKTTSHFLGHEWQTGVPVYPFTQVQHYLAVTGYDLAYVACLIGGQQFVYYEVYRDDEFIDKLIKEELSFWQRVTDRNPPEADGLARTTQLLNEKYAYSEPGKLAILDAGDLDILRAYRERRDIIKEMQKLNDTLANILRTRMGDAERGALSEDSFDEITWKTVTQKRVDVGLVKTFPEIYAQCLKETQYRRFVIRGSGESDDE